MGYRSEVAIAIQEKDFEKLKAHPVVAGNGSAETIMELLLYADKILKDDDVIIIHWDWIKWYKDFESVSMVMNFLDDCADGYAFVEIGEDGATHTLYEESSDGRDFYDYICETHAVYISTCAVDVDKLAYLQIARLEEV